MLNHLTMKKNILIVLLIPFYFSCKTKLGNDLKKVSIVLAQQPIDFVCNYEKQKTVCLKLQQLSLTNELENKIVSTICDSLIPCWYGTTWNFYGTSETPGKGTIACGYFVTTVIRDAGIPIQRIKMAQVPSEEMIRNVCERSSIKRFSNISIGDFTREVKAMGFGLYVTGLDSHTGFIYNDGNEVYFIHSNYSTPKCVVKEIAAQSAVLAYSKYRVIGKIKL